MKKALKITGITLASILVVLIVAVIVVCNIVFSPKTLTPIVRNNIGRFVTCKTDVDTVDLTFFSSFPHFALKIDGVTLENKIDSSAPDTLVAVETLSAKINLMEFVRHQNVMVDYLILGPTVANVYVDSAGNANYDIVAMSSDTDSDSDTTSAIFNILSIDQLSVEKLSLSYDDRQNGIMASANNISASLNGNMQSMSGNVAASVSAESIVLSYNDSIDVSAGVNDLQLTASGTLADNNFYGTVALTMPNTSLVMDGETLVDNRQIGITVPLSAALDLSRITPENATLFFENNTIRLNGNAGLNGDDISTDLDLAVNIPDVAQFISLIPKSYAEPLEGIDLAGRLDLKGKAKGIYNDSTMPVITADINFDNGRVSYPEVLPYKLYDTEAVLSAVLNLNKDSISSAHISKISTKTGSMSFMVSGDVDNIIDNPLLDVKLKANVSLPELKPLIPEDLPVVMNGRLNADIAARFALNDAMDMKIEKIKADGTIKYSDLDILYNDSIAITDEAGSITIALPSKNSSKQLKELAELTLSGSNIGFDMLGTMQAVVRQPVIGVGLGEFRDTTRVISARCNFSMANLSGSMDTISFNLDKPSGSARILPNRKKPENPIISFSYAGDRINAEMGSFLKVNTDAVNVSAATNYDPQGKNIFLQLNPLFKIDFNNGKIDYSGINTPLLIPAIKCRFTPNNFDIEESHIIIENSDFNLSGNVHNLKKFIKKEGLLKGDLLFESEHTDVNELMAIVNGMGSEDEESEPAKEETTETAEAGESGPFMVPKGVDLSFMTDIHNAVFGSTELQSVKGKLTIKDGVAVVEQMGFSSEAAEMQLTGIYRSDRPNHLFCGLDFHLLNIDIRKLIDMIPEVDTIVPMLKSFDGKAEFHIAAETYLNRHYQPKISTLRAAAALEGKDLVLMDSETFSTIAKYMKFNKKTKNIVDSISVEMTVFRDEVDLYPFLISMDKWQAVLSGRHNLDMSFDYHISLTDCPLPVRLGLDVRGNIDDLKFKLVPCKYKYLYKPEKQKTVDKQTMSLKKIISDSLKDNVK